MDVLANTVGYVVSTNPKNGYRLIQSLQFVKLSVFAQLISR